MEAEPPALGGGALLPSVECSATCLPAWRQRGRGDGTSGAQSVPSCGHLGSSEKAGRSRCVSLGHSRVSIGSGQTQPTWASQRWLSGSHSLSHLLPLPSHPAPGHSVHLPGLCTPHGSRRHVTFLGGRHCPVATLCGWGRRPDPAPLSPSFRFTAPSGCWRASCLPRDPCRAARAPQRRCAVRL